MCCGAFPVDQEIVISAQSICYVIVFPVHDVHTDREMCIAQLPIRLNVLPCI